MTGSTGSTPTFSSPLEVNSLILHHTIVSKTRNRQSRPFFSDSQKFNCSSSSSRVPILVFLMDEMSETSASSTMDKKRRSTVWEHFKQILDKDKVECLYCGANIGCASGQGTGSMHRHLSRCKEYPYANVDKRQRSALGRFGGVGSSSGPWKFDQDVSRMDLATMFIIELPTTTTELNLTSMPLDD
ncbi:uncharacterized protein LOC125314600 [Rhodamnia argentea]|uniref:Uncharacterized protein LOC125314600 n=1 Tax=Rhodamnia argentea TaxID=178133 RepID=A0ABM3H9K9_9MYRT|nr:uncharacterized protein LOC125314600 [Rhodamnia argentea]